MSHSEDDQAKKIALFRYSVIADLLHLEPGEAGLYERMRKKAEREYEIPGTLRTRVAVETMRTWLRWYRQRGGFDALMPKTRTDVGVSRRLSQEISDALVDIKDNNKNLSVRDVISVARKTGKVKKEIALAQSTVARLLRRHDLMPRRDCSASAPAIDRRRFSYERAGELWMSDVMHGPAVFEAGRKKRKTFLIAFIDDATRMIPHAQFAFSENTTAFMPVLKQAILRRGIPKRLFVDNGAAYRSQHLDIVMAKMGITLIHARPRDAAAKGKIERWFRTVRLQLLPNLTPRDLDSIESLNRRLWLYVEQEYHRRPHRGLADATPSDAWAARSDDVRYVGSDCDLEELFLMEARRKVRKDRTLSLNGRIYEVDPVFIGATVLVRYDPSHPARAVYVENAGERSKAQPVDVHANCHIKRERPHEGKDAPVGFSLSSMDDGGCR